MAHECGTTCVAVWHLRDASTQPAMPIVNQRVIVAGVAHQRGKPLLDLAEWSMAMHLEAHEH